MTRHVRAEQVAHRILLHIRRRTTAHAGGALRRVHERAAAPPLAADLPRPLLPPRSALLRRASDGRPIADLAGQPWPVTPPIDWHPDAIPRGTLRKLHLHYMEYGETLGDAEFVAATHDWIAANPPYTPHYWADAWNSYALSVRCVVWMQQFAARPAARDRLGDRVLRSLAAQLRFLERNLERDIVGNHLIKNIKALLWGGRFFAGREAERWRRVGERELAGQLDEQVLADGMHYERSASYHTQVFVDLLECRTVVSAGAMRERLDGALARMAQVVADLTHPDGGCALFNDAGTSMAYPAERALAACEQVLGTRPAPRPAFALPAAGYWGLRGADSLFVVDCGAVSPDFLPAHAHGDILAFEWSLGGRRVVVDAGVYEYLPGPARAWARGTAAHNTVTVADTDQCEFWGAFRVGRRAAVRCEHAAVTPDRLTLRGEHDGFRHLAGAPTHKRAVAATLRGVDVVDRVDGGAGQPVRARLLLHHDCTVRRVSDAALEVTCASVRVAVRADRPVAVTEATWSPDLGTRHPTRQLVFEYGNAPCTGHFTLERVDDGGIADG